MSSVLYYSNYCEHSKKLLQKISSMEFKSEMHFVCIDKRVQDAGKIYIVLENGQKLLMPESINKVPALLLLDNYSVLYGESIHDYLRPKQQLAIKKATNNNIEPNAFSFSSGGSYGISSDNYSFLDMDSASLSATGTGGLRQMHNYVHLNDSMNLSMQLPQDDTEYKTNKLKEGEMSVEALQRRRAEELSNINYK